ncbi:MAG: hypothetical protein WCI50_10090 [Actinomycetes bacterium]
MAHYVGLDADRAYAARAMPHARELTIDGTTGFVYEFECEFGTRYVLFAWFDGLCYKVKLVEPDFERTGPVGHATHLYADGTLCLDPQMHGLRTLADAYTRSVVWATGHSIFRTTGVFAFNVTNLDRTPAT